MSLIKIPRAAYEGILAVRETGRTNMFDRPMVQVIANELEFYATVLWLEDNPKEYGLGIIRGFEPMDEPAKGWA